MEERYSLSLNLIQMQTEQILIRQHKVNTWVHEEKCNMNRRWGRGERAGGRGWGECVRTPTPHPHPTSNFPIKAFPFHYGWTPLRRPRGWTPLDISLNTHFEADNSERN